jgi:hypothetical protein
MHRSKINRRNNQVNLMGYLDGIIDWQVVGQAIKNIGWFFNELSTLPRRYYVAAVVLVTVATSWYVFAVIPHEKWLMETFSK